MSAKSTPGPAGKNSRWAFFALLLGPLVLTACGPGAIAETASEARTCIPDCTGKECGDNGCGGICGVCDEDALCNGRGTCYMPADCAPDCAGRECGDDGCGGSCGSCIEGDLCDGAGSCYTPADCAPDCAGRECGDDGCGGSCGDCAGSARCNGLGVCYEPETCTPSCDAKECGDDGCGGSCGGCAGDEACNALGSCYDPNACIPDCSDSECGDDGCGASCGACDGSDRCVSGVCEVCIPNCVGRTCGQDGCGGSCGACTGGETCSAAGTCFDSNPCVPDCSGKECGDDGCGGSCGGCGGGQACESAVCVDTSPPPCEPETCTSLGLDCGQADDGCGGTINCGSCSSGANVFWSSSEQTGDFPFNLDWTTCENPISSPVSCTNGDGDGAEFDLAADPVNGSGFAIRQYADLRSGGGRSQGAVLSQAQPAIDALFDNQEEIWFYTEYFFPQPVVGSGWLHFFGFQQTGSAGRVTNNPAINFWSQSDSSGGYYPGDMDIGIYWTNFTQLQKATLPMPIGKWVEFEFMYKRSSGNGARDGAAQIWIDDVLVVDQRQIETWQSGHGNLEIYWNLYGRTSADDWNDPSPEYYIRNLKIGDAKMSTGYLR